MAKEDKFMKWLGIIFMLMGVLAVISAFPGVPLSTVNIGPLEFRGVDAPDVTQMAVGAVLFFLGMTAYKRR